ncbi:unnamed protein product [Sphagnum balticum]
MDPSSCVLPAAEEDDNAVHRRSISLSILEHREFWTNCFAPLPISVALLSIPSRVNKILFRACRFSSFGLEGEFATFLLFQRRCPVFLATDRPSRQAFVLLLAEPLRKIQLQKFCQQVCVLVPSQRVPESLFPSRTEPQLPLPVHYSLQAVF